MMSYGMRNLISPCVTILAMVPCLAGCREVSPIVSGTVIDGGLFLKQFTVVHGDKNSETWELTPLQVEKLAGWLQGRESRWHMNFASRLPPSYSVVVAHADGSRSQLDLFAKDGIWDETMNMYQYDNNGTFLFGGTQTISADEIEALKKMLFPNR
jgi:hypothetical protein